MPAGSFTQQNEPNVDEPIYTGQLFSNALFLSSENGAAPEPVSVSLAWLNFTLANTLVLLGATASVINVYYDMDVTILKSLFLENDGSDYFNYANNRIFQTLDVAKFTTLSVPAEQMQDSALAYAALQTGLTLSEISNKAQWLTVFRAEMETQLTLLDSTAMSTYDMGTTAPFKELDRITMSRNATTDVVTVGTGSFTSKPLFAGDIMYFDVTCTFTEGVAAQTYRVNLRARNPYPEDYPLLFLPPPDLTEVYVYLCNPTSLLTGEVWVINGDEYTVPFQTVAPLSGVNIMKILGFVIIFSTSAITVGEGVPAGVSMTGGVAFLNWLLSVTEGFESIPSITAYIFFNNAYTEEQVSLTNSAALTTQGKLFMTNPFGAFTLIDDRVRESDAAYDLLGFNRQQPYPSYLFTYFQSVPPDVTPLDGFYFVMPIGDTAAFTVTLTTNAGTTVYAMPDIVAGTYEMIKKIGNLVCFFSDGVRYPEVTETVLSDPAIVLNACVIYRDSYVCVAPLPVTEGLIYTPTTFDSYFIGIPDLFAYQFSSFLLDPDTIKYAINNSETPFYCSIIERQTTEKSFQFLQLENPEPFTVEIWDDGGFHEPRVSTQMSSAEVAVRLTVDGNGGAGSYESFYNVGITVSSITGITRTNAILESFNTSINGTGTVIAPPFIITKNTTCYAQWSAVRKITYDANGLTASSPPTNTNFYGVGDAVIAAEPGGMQNGSLIFTGWNTAADGSGTSYAVGATLYLVTNIYLYAQWGAPDRAVIMVNQTPNITKYVYDINNTVALTIPDGSPLSYYSFVLLLEDDPQWFSKIQLVGGDVTYNLSTDGGFYVSGAFSNSNTIFSNGVADAAFTLQSAGSTDTFVVKYNSTGLAQWTCRISGVGQDSISSNFVDTNNNIYLSGWTTAGSAVNLYTASGAVVELIPVQSGGSEGFVVIVNSVGEVVAFALFKGALTDQAVCVTYNSLTDSIYMGGTTFNSGSAFQIQDFNGTNPSLTTNFVMNADAFISKLTNVGNTTGTQWLARVTGTFTEKPFAIGTDSLGNVYALVYSKGSTAVYSANSAAVSISFDNPSNSHTYIIVKYSPTGLYEWAMNITGTTVSGVCNLLVSQDGVYVQLFCSTTRSTLTINPFSGPAVTSPNTSLVLFKISYAGAFLWAAYITGAVTSPQPNLSKTASGDIYLEVGYSGELSIDDTTPTVVSAGTISSLGTALLKFNSTGEATVICRSDIA